MIEQIKLSPSEAKVVAALLDGMLLPDISKRHNMSLTFTRNCASRAYAKCGVNAAHQLVVQYYSHEVQFITRDGKFV